MRTLSANVQAALDAGALVPRDFLWIVARNRATDAAETWGAWSGAGNVDADVIDPDSGSTVTRAFEGAGSLIQIGAVPMVSGLTVQVVEIRLSQIAAGAEQLVRGYDVRRAPVQLFRGFLDPATQRMVGPAVPRFVGFVDEADVQTPKEGEEGAITLTCASHAQELTRASTAKRSDADQRQRSATDGFYRHTATVGDWTIYWGRTASE